MPDETQIQKLPPVSLMLTCGYDKALVDMRPLLIALAPEPDPVAHSRCAHPLAQVMARKEAETKAKGISVLAALESPYVQHIEAVLQKAAIDAAKRLGVDPEEARLYRNAASGRSFFVSQYAPLGNYAYAGIVRHNDLPGFAAQWVESLGLGGQPFVWNTNDAEDGQTDSLIEAWTLAGSAAGASASPAKKLKL